jgi:hypothetical protein
MQTKPDYDGGSIVNLMSSIAHSLILESPYGQLRDYPIQELDEAKNIVLLIMDGLGYNYLQRSGKNSFLAKHLKGSITSVFPPSTGPAITSFFTGVAPQQHAVTGWFVYLQEFGILSRILLFSNVIDNRIIGVNPSNVINQSSIFRELGSRYHIVLGDHIIDSVYTKHMAGGAARHGYSDISSMFNQVKDILDKESGRTYTHVYWPELDSISHFLGVESGEAKDHLNEFDVTLANFIESIKETDTVVIVTSDHGFNDVEIEDIIYTRDHPSLVKTLSIPLAGDTRARYCYVKPFHVNAFERYVTDELGDFCNLHRSNELQEGGWFGLFEPSEKLSGRIGDYTILMKEGHAMMNCYPGSEPPQLRGHHGGVSQDEMNVPLIVIDTQD